MANCQIPLICRCGHRFNRRVTTEEYFVECPVCGDRQVMPDWSRIPQLKSLLDHGTRQVQQLPAQRGELA